ncbi:hypothetical protein C8Q79DRAFT_1004354 [Trametes meyenii]|nr:hypothetical protein C8Q79DRAFT_1004354 [Trametes meyenii]
MMHLANFVLAALAASRVLAAPVEPTAAAAATSELNGLDALNGILIPAALLGARQADASSVSSDIPTLSDAAVRAITTTTVPAATSALSVPSGDVRAATTAVALTTLSSPADATAATLAQRGVSTSESALPTAGVSTFVGEVAAESTLASATTAVPVSVPTESVPASVRSSAETDVLARDVAVPSEAAVGAGTITSTLCSDVVVPTTTAVPAAPTAPVSSVSGVRSVSAPAPADVGTEKLEAATSILSTVTPAALEARFHGVISGVPVPTAAAEVKVESVTVPVSTTEAGEKVGGVTSTATAVAEKLEGVTSSVGVPVSTTSA